MDNFDVCKFLGCNACEGSFDCPVRWAYKFLYGSTPSEAARGDLRVWFPRKRDKEEIQRRFETQKVEQLTFKEQMEATHDRVVDNYDASKARVEAKKNRFSKKPTWVK